MKKNLLFLSGICLLALTSCDGVSSTIGTSSDSESVLDTTSETTTIEDSTTTGSTTTSIQEKEWTEADKKIFEDHYGGYVLPFIGFDQYTLYWDHTNEFIVLSATDSTTTKAENYCTALEDEGFINSSFDSDGTTVYQCEKKLENFDYLYLQSYNASTQFIMVCWMESPVTTWPSTAIDTFFTGHSITVNDTVPEFSADHYYVNDYFEDYNCLEIKVPNGVVAETEDKYINVLTTAGWDVSKTNYDDKGVVAIAPNETIEINFYVYEGNFYIDIYGYTKKVGWPTDQIATALGTEITETVPEFVTSESFAVTVEEPSDQNFLNISLATEITDTANAITNSEIAYENTLKAANWVISRQNYDTFGIEAVSPLEQIFINFFYEEGYFFINIAKNADFTSWVHTEAWPESTIKAYLPEGCLVPPAVKDATNFQNMMISRESGKIKGIIVRTRVDNPETALASYAKTINDTNLWDFESNDETIFIFKSKDGTTSLKVYTNQPSSSGYKYLNIEITNVYVVPQGFIDFSSVSQRTTFTEDLATYVNGKVTVKIEKGTSDFVVGGGSQLYMPDSNGYARIYANQVITITVNETVKLDSIVITCESDKGTKGIQNGTITGATGVYDSVNFTATLTPSEGVNEVKIQVSAQVRLASINVSTSNR